MTATGITQSTSGQGGLELIRSIAESTGPQGAPRPRFFIRPSTHALQAAAAPNISVTQTMGSASTTSGPFTNTITQSASFRVPSQSVSSASSSSLSPGVQQVQNYQSAFPQPMQFGASMPPIPQMPMFAQQSQSSSSSSGGIIQIQSQSHSSGPGSYSYSSSQSQSSQRSPPRESAMAPKIPSPIPYQQASPPRDIYQQAPPQQQDNRINNWVQPGSHTIQQQNLPLPPPQLIQYPQQMIIQQQQQQQLQQIIPQENSSIINQSIGATLMASTSASNAAVYHQSLQQDRMFQSMEPFMEQASSSNYASMQRSAQPQRRGGMFGGINRSRNQQQERRQIEVPQYNMMSVGSSFGANQRRNAQRRRAPQTQHAFLDNEDNEAFEAAAQQEDEDEQRSGSDDNLDLRMVMQEMAPQRAAALQEDLLFAPQMHGQQMAEYVGQRALEAVGHLSASGTYLPFPADFSRPQVEGQSILQPPPAKINPVPFEQRLQQFRQSLMQYVQQYQQQGRAGQRQGQWQMWGYENNTGNITLNVKRGYSLVQSSFDQFMSAGVGNWKDNLVVQFDGEQGQDLGGVRREWYSIIIPSITNPDYGLFAIDSDNDNRVSVSHLAGSAQEEAGTDINQFFRFVGAVIGKAVTDGITVQAPFTRFLFKTLLGQEAHVSDVASHDPELTTQLKQMEQDDVTDYNIPFSLNMDFFGEIREIELVNGGANIAVNNDNKLDFIALCANHRLVGLTAAYMAALRRGFLEVIPVHLLDAAQLTPEELELILCGRPQIDIDDWEQNTNYQEGFTKESPTVQWFWDILKNDLNEKQRGDLLAFTTGSRRPPAQGFKAMIGTSIQDPRLFTIRQRVDFTANQLPVAHTCFNLIDFPAQYENKDQMKAKLLQALETLPSGFTIA